MSQFFFSTLFSLPVGVYVLVGFGLLYALILLDERRENRKEKRLGYRITWISSGVLRAGENDWALTYREQGREFFFYGKYVKDKKRWTKILNVPSAENWDTMVPEWAQGRREEITGRIRAEGAKYRVVIREI